MNILMTSYNPFKESGGQVSTYFLARALKKLGHRVYIASTGNYKEIETIKIPNYKKIPKFSYHEKISTKVFKKIIKEKKIEIIHAHDRLTIPGAIKAAQQTGIKSVIHFRSYDFLCPNATCLTGTGEIYDVASDDWRDMIIEGSTPFYKGYWNIYKWAYIKRCWPLLKQADLAISVSQNIADKHKKIGVDSKVVGNIREIDIPKISNFKEKYNLKKYVLTYLGRISYAKGTISMLINLKEVLKKRKDVSLFIAGSGDIKEVKDKIDRWNLQNVILSGKIPFDDIPKLYAVSDMVILPSRYEAGPAGPILESMIAGIPVIATNNGGSVDVIEDGKNGFLLDLDDKEIWGKKVNLLLNDDELRKQMGANAKEESKKYTSEVIGKKMEELYMELLK